MFSFAVISDLHLPDREDTVKDLVLDWALQKCRELHVDLIVCAGDVTSIGTQQAAARFSQKLKNSGIPFLATPGNAELRRPQYTAKVLKLLETPSIMNGIMMLDSSRIAFSESSRLLLRAANRQSSSTLVAVTHVPPEVLPKEDIKLLQEAIDAGKVSMVIFGHNHVDVRQGVMQGVRGLDPDRALGGPAALAVFRRGEDGWLREDIACPHTDIAAQPDNAMAAFGRHFGISISESTLDCIKTATELQIPALAFRYSEDIFFLEHKLQEAFAMWRAAGGAHLAFHFPEMSPDPDMDEELKFAGELALKFGCKYAMLHIPSFVSIEEMSYGAFKERLLERMAKAIGPFLRQGGTIGFENSHIEEKENDDSDRRFGCSPSEVKNWIQWLREKTGSEAIGFHLDIGRARNNWALASKYNLSHWFAELGDIITGIDVNQFQIVDGANTDHLPMKSLYSEYIPLGSMFYYWSSGTIKPCPVFVETFPETPVLSYKALRDLLF